MEIVDLYTVDRRLTGETMIRGERTPPNRYRLVVHVCIFNREGQMLIQQRQSFKHGWPNLWDVSIGGAAATGDTSREAAEREVLEELGLHLDLQGVRPALTIPFSGGFDDFYVVTRDYDLAQVHMQKEEVQAVRWASEQEVYAMMDEGTFIPYHKPVMALLFYYRNHYGTVSRPDITAMRQNG